MGQQELFGQLILTEENNTHPTLHLDGIPIKENQILLVKYGEGSTPKPDRACRKDIK